MNEKILPNNKNNMQEEKSGSVWKSKDVLWIIIGIGVLFLIGTLFLVYRYSNSQSESGLTFQPSIQLSILMGLLECVALLGGVYLLGLRRRGLSWRAVGIQPLSSKWLWSSLLLGLLVIPVTGFIAVLVQLAIGNPLENPQLDFIVPEGFSWLGLLGMLLVGGILAPFAEEVFFRGVLFDWMHYRWGIWIGTLVSSAVFGLVHGEISVTVAAFVLGILLAWVKGVEIGPAFENARLPGTQAQDAIRLEGEALVRQGTRNGGLEGGVTTGQPLLLRAAMKPIATTLTAQPSVDLASGVEVQTQYERSDFCPVPRAVPILEAMVAFILAQALLEKLGGDSMNEIRPRYAALRRPSLGDLKMDAKDEHIFWPEE